MDCRLNYQTIPGEGDTYCLIQAHRLINISWTNNESWHKYLMEQHQGIQRWGVCLGKEALDSKTIELEQEQRWARRISVSLREAGSSLKPSWLFK